MRSERGVAVKPLPPPGLLLPHPHTPARAAAPRLHPDARVGGGAHPQPPSEVGTDAGGGREKTLRYRVTHLEARLKKAEGQAAEKEELARKGLAESQRLVRGGWFASWCRGSAGCCVDHRPRAAAQSSWWWRRQGRLLDARDERVKALQAALRQMQKNEMKRADKAEARAAGAGGSSGGGGSGRADSGQVAPERRFIQVTTPIQAARSV
jgi:hypothetical protein